jgi:hypothetical protein
VADPRYIARETVVEAAEHRANVLLETTKLLFLTLVRPENWLKPVLQESAPIATEIHPPKAFPPHDMLVVNSEELELVVVENEEHFVNTLLETE